MADASRPMKRPRNGIDQSFDQSTSGPSTLACDARAPESNVSGDNAKKPPGKKPPLSCAECRRLKLKCDRVFPCHSCCKRGCQEICPDGALTSGRGSRFILANTEQLHEKIIQLSDRIRQLEDALQALQSSCSNEPHPLLRQELLRIKTSLELYSAPQAGRSSDAITEDKVATSHPSEREVHSTVNVPHATQLSKPMVVMDLPQDILKLSASFPIPWKLDPTLRQRIRDMLPTREEAEFLCEHARQNALFQYNLDGSETFMPNLIHHVYNSSIQTLSFRRVALLFMMLAMGTAVDLNQPPGSQRAEVFHQLARVCICEMPLMEEPNFDLLRGMFYMIWYLLIFSDMKKAVGYAWNMMGLTTKLAQSIGLHREASRAKVIPEELEKRRMFFWELLSLDCRLSLSLGRPPSLQLHHVDCRRPSYTAAGVYASKEEATYHQWKHSFYVYCLNPVLQMIVTAQPPDYNSVMKLDTDVRNFPVPIPLQTIARTEGSPRFLIIQRTLVSTGRDIALLQLHRSHFTQALSGPDPFTLNHKYAPSVLATYCSAAAAISAIRMFYNAEPQLSLRYLGPWFNTFSLSIALCLIVSRAPSSPLAPIALQELESVCQLFRHASTGLPFTAKALPILEKSAEKSRRAYLHWRELNDPNSYTPTVTHHEHPTFPCIHPSLQQCLEQVVVTPHPMIHQIPIFSNSTEPLSPPSVPELEDSLQHLPSVYGFNSAGLQSYHEPTSVGPSTDDAALVAEKPRLAANEEFHLDFGVITDQSYMAWF